MPFKSKAQRRKFAELLVKGEITPETYEEWNRETGSKELPERVGKPKRKTSARAALRGTNELAKRAASRAPARKRSPGRKTARSLKN